MKLISDNAMDFLNNLLENLIHSNNLRSCSHCGKIFFEGYVIEDGVDYYCNDKCLEANMTREEFDELFNGGNGDSYYTEWPYNEDLYQLLIELNSIFPDLKYKIQDVGETSYSDARTIRVGDKIRFLTEKFAFPVDALEILKEYGNSFIVDSINYVTRKIKVKGCDREFSLHHAELTKED